jgi:Mor family transcriptional regulator
MDINILKHAPKLHPHDILQPFAAMMELSGFDAVCALSEHYGGHTIYVPRIRTIFAQCLEEEIRKEYSGTNMTMLSKKYGYTVRHLRRVVGKC